MYSTIIAAIFLASSASITYSLPSSPGKFCSYPKTYQLTSAIEGYQDPVLITGSTKVGPDPDRAKIDAGHSYSTSFNTSGEAAGQITKKALQKITQDAAATLHLTKFGLSSSKGTSKSPTLYCPASVVCGLTAAAKFVHVEGTETTHICGFDGKTDPDTYPCQLSAPHGCSAKNAGVPIPFSADFPVKLDNSQVDGQDNIVTHFDACAMGHPDGGLSQCPENTSSDLPGMTCNLVGCTTETCEQKCADIGAPLPSPTCEWSSALKCSWCNCRSYFYMSD